MTGTPPRISVLMPVHNGADFLRPAIDSILAQTCTDFEFLIIDDGSTDSSFAICSEYRDPRIRLERNETNLGLIATLNKGLGLVRGEFVARMDCDDICLPRRLEKQLAFLDKHPDVGICGTWFEKFHDGGSEIIEVPAEDAYIRFSLVFDNAFGHNTIMMRKSLLDEHGLRYDPDFKYAEDYEFWVRCARYTRLANLPEVFVRYRYHPDNTSNRFRREQGATADRVRRRQIEASGLAVDDAALDMLNSVLKFEFQGDFGQLELAGQRLLALAGQAAEKWGVPRAFAYRKLSLHWYGACGSLAEQGLGVWRLFLSMPMGRAAAWHWQWKMLARCAMRKRIEPAEAEVSP
jgi:glycosyltransferase involved in cell wall biosynthesis